MRLIIIPLALIAALSVISCSARLSTGPAFVVPDDKKAAAADLAAKLTPPLHDNGYSPRANAEAVSDIVIRIYGEPVTQSAH